MSGEWGDDGRIHSARMNWKRVADQVMPVDTALISFACNEASIGATSSFSSFWLSLQHAVFCKDVPLAIFIAALLAQHDDTTLGLQLFFFVWDTSCIDLPPIIAHWRSVRTNPVLLSRTRKAIRMVIDRRNLFFIGPKILIIRRFLPLHSQPF